MHNTHKLTPYIHRLKNKLKIVGPGFITGSADDDPSGIGTYSVAGAQFGPKLLWLVPFQLPLMYAMQHMAGKIGLVTGKGLAANMQAHVPKVILYGCLAILIFANALNIGADISIMAASAHLLLGASPALWAIIMTAAVMAMQIFISYHLYSKILLLFSSFLLSYAVAAFMAVDDWWEIVRFMAVPTMEWNKEFLLVITGFIGTTISPYLFFWQTAQEVEEINEHGHTKKTLKMIKELPTDTFSGMLFSQLMSLFIVVTCYTTLYKNGITTIVTPDDAARALEPFAGKFASLIFSVGIIGAGLLGIPVLAGSSAYALAEIFDKPRSLAHQWHEAQFFYGVIALSTLAGLAINFLGINPIDALLYAAIINCIAAVPFVAFVLVLANKKNVMGMYKNNLFLNIMGGATLLIMIACSAVTLYFQVTGA